MIWESSVPFDGTYSDTTLFVYYVDSFGSSLLVHKLADQREASEDTLIKMFV